MSVNWPKFNITHYLICYLLEKRFIKTNNVVSKYNNLVAYNITRFTLSCVFYFENINVNNVFGRMVTDLLARPLCETCDWSPLARMKTQMPRPLAYEAAQSAISEVTIVFRKNNIAIVRIARKLYAYIVDN